MSILDKKLLLEEIEKRLNDFVPANTVAEIIRQANDVAERFEVIALPDGPDREGEDLVKLFLEAKRCESKSEKTIERYRYILARLQKDTSIPLARMTVYHLRSYLTAEKERGIAPITLDGYRSVYASFYGWLFKERLIEYNPCATLAPIKVPKEIRKPFDDVELDQLRECAVNKRDAALIAFLRATGCRVSEVCALNREDVDFHDLKLTVFGKGAKVRTVYIDELTAMRLTRYLRTREDDCPALFVGLTRKERLTPGGVRFALHRIANKAGVEGVHPHRFRRTLATNLIDHGASVQDVATILGHDKLDTTMTYVYMRDKNVEYAYRKYA